MVGRPADAVGEDEVVVLPGGRLQPFLILAQLVSSQGSHCAFVEGYGAAAGLVLRRAEAQRDSSMAGGSANV